MLTYSELSAVNCKLYFRYLLRNVFSQGRVLLSLKYFSLARLFYQVSSFLAIWALVWLSQLALAKSLPSLLAG